MSAIKETSDVINVNMSDIFMFSFVLIGINSIFIC